ncbi:CRISPR-associated helicase/endonuclease Cas3 [Caminibacter profundus]
MIVKEKNLKEIFDRFFEIFELKDKEFGFRIIKDAVVLHDEGKVNPNFQYFVMGNEEFKDKAFSKSDTNHSMLSAVMFYERYIYEVMSEEDDAEYEKKHFLLLLMCYLISKHHSKLDDFKEFVESFEYEIGKKIYVEFKFSEEIYIFAKLVFSLLISSDYFATTEYMLDIEYKEFSSLDVKSLKRSFNEFYKSLKPQKEIDFVRKEIFKEAISNLDTSKSVFYLNAPTGAGKTYISLNLALNLNPKKIIYVFPFNTLVDQSKNSIENALNIKTKIINSITPIEIRDEYSDELAYIERIMFDYDFAITTHVNFFEILFGISKEDNFSLWQLVDSVVIIDEIQSYNIDLWQMMAFWFEKFSKLLNMKIIIMSATLPKIDKLLNKNSFYDLLNKNYFKEKVFKERVKAKFIGNVEFEDLEELILKQNDRKILVEFIKKESANGFYEFMKENKKYETFVLTGDDNKLYRDYVINECKKDKNILLISTQVIEAGVDIDMDVGFKDISLLENEEQFAGRVNRNGLKTSKIYFFDIDEASIIYKNDPRLEFNIKNSFSIFENKEYEKYYEAVLERVYKKTQKIIDVKTKEEHQKSFARELNFRALQNEMKLIKTYTLTIFLPFKIDLRDEKYCEIGESEFVKNGFLDGMLVWRALKEVKSIKNYAKRKIRQSFINYYMQFFTFEVNKYTTKINKFSDECCGIYMIEDFEEFVDENFRLLRDKFNEYQEDMFL